MQSTAWKGARVGPPANSFSTTSGCTLTAKQKCVTDIAIMPELNLEETTRVRTIFFSFVREEYVTTKFELRVLLSELGLYPSPDEIAFVLNHYEGKMSFTNFCHYLRFYKKKFQVSALQRNASHAEASSKEESEDTLRAFVSLGGNEDGSGRVNLEDLRQACHNFDLTIDIDELLSGIVDVENQTTFNYAEFCSMWRSKLQQNECSANSSVASQFGILSTMLAIGGDNSTMVCANPTKSESSATGVITARSLFHGWDENAAESFRFLQAPDCNNRAISAQQREDAFAQLGSEKEHIRQLKVFLCSDSAKGLCSSSQLFLGRHRSNFCTSANTAQWVSAFNGDCVRTEAPAREEGGGAGGAKKGKHWANTAQCSGGAVGGYRAPSPMILSLRNSNAYKKRLQAFARKTNMSTNNKKGCTRKRDHSIPIDDDNGRN